MGGGGRSQPPGAPLPEVPRPQEAGVLAVPGGGRVR